MRLTYQVAWWVQFHYGFAVLHGKVGEDEDEAHSEIAGD